MTQESGSPSLLGISELIVPTGTFFHAQTLISFHIIEELSSKARESLFPLDVYILELQWNSQQDLRSKRLPNQADAINRVTTLIGYPS